MRDPEPGQHATGVIRALRSRLTGGARAAAAVAAVAVLASPVTAASAAPAQPSSAAPVGGLGLRLLDAPVTARDDPRARLYIVDHLAPGTVINRRIEVTNTTAATARVALYAAAAGIAGGSFLGAEGRAANELSTWTTVSPATADVAAGGRITATVTVAVPRDAPPGEQLGVVWAQASSVSAGSGVKQVNRVGIRLYLSVGPGGAPAANFTVDSVTAVRGADGRPALIAAVHNTGGRALDMSGSLRLQGGPGGLNAGPFPVELAVTLAIGATGSVTVTLDERLPAGPWQAHLTLGSGLVNRTANATVTFPAAGAAPTVSIASDRPGWRYPAVSMVAVLLLGAVVWRLARRRRRAGATGDGTPSA